MRSNELRIGNWVYNQTISKNTQVYPMMIPQLHRIENENGSLDNCNIKPIHLTEEMLLNCGFEKEGSTVYINIGSIEIGTVANGKRFYIQISSQNITLEIKHLHQLQNLYFALTGEELEINL